MSVLKNIFIFFLVTAGAACTHKNSAQTETAVDIRTPVTVIPVSYDPMQEFIELNATATYLEKNYVKSNLTGYIKSVMVRFASTVSPGQTLFVLKTKESEAIGNTINKLDPGFKFSGVNVIRAATGGYVSELNHQAGDYVQDGDPLATISNLNSFAFVMNVPFEYRPYIKSDKQVEIELPGGERLQGFIQTHMPFMDSVSQTQAVAVRVQDNRQLPQNLVVKVKIITVTKAAAISLPRGAVLTDETQSSFWVMKLIDDSTAAKVEIKKGIETAERIEIVSPQFGPKDKIIVTGNYGLPDTAKIKIEGVK